MEYEILYLLLNWFILIDLKSFFSIIITTRNTKKIKDFLEIFHIHIGNTSLCFLFLLRNNILLFDYEQTQKKEII